ncbi:hypothetical protein B6V00_04440 [ANME-1 cluster archaeon ex4572_4]|nr:hypothetical protein [Methanophagales archaeon]OYT65538.1 MAG: hypothetical protein B6V00_04440 [ANME-1 cluster archaeon ex4572_4]PXF51277.1 MAG: hypothetical protein C4B55_02445 [Methanophagales archaeon]
MTVVRILGGEGQFEVSSAVLNRINELDNKIVEEVEEKNEERFRELLVEMILVVKREGKALDPAEIVESDVIVPPADLSLEEAKKIFTGEGIIPD